MSGFPSKSLPGNRKSAIQNPKWLGLALIALVLVMIGARLEAQQRKKMAQIGYLSPLSGPPPVLAALKERLRELGWVEGKTSNLRNAMAMASAISILSLRPNLFAWKLMSSSRGRVARRLMQPSV
jgi:hypothetical protein